MRTFNQIAGAAKAVRSTIEKAAAGATAVLLAGTASIAQAAPGYQLQTSGASGWLGSIEQWIVMWCNFATTTWGILIVILGFVAAGTIWALMPKSGALAIAARVAVVGLVFFNLSTFIGMFALTSNS